MAAETRDRRDYESQRIDRHGDYSSSRWYSLGNEKERVERERERERPGLERRRTSDYDTNAGALVVRETIPRDDGSVYVRETVTYRDRDRDDEMERDRRLPPAPAPPHWDDRPLDRPGGRASSRVRFASPPRDWDRDARDRRDRDREFDTRIDIKEHYRDIRRDETRERSRDWERERDPSDLEHDRRLVDSYTRIERSPYGRRDSPPRHAGGAYGHGEKSLFPVARRESPPPVDRRPFPKDSRYAPDDFDRYGRRDVDNYGHPPRDADAFDRYGNESLYRDRYAAPARTVITDDSSHYDRVSEHEIIRREQPRTEYTHREHEHQASRYHEDSSAVGSARPGYHRSRSMSLPPQARPPAVMKKIQIVTAMRAYKGTHTGDLTIVEGDLVRVTGKHGRHWLIGKNVDTQAQGFFPKEFVEGYESEEEEVDIDVREYRNEPSVSVSERSGGGGAGGYGPTVMVSSIPHNSTLKSDMRSQEPGTIRTTTTYARQPGGYRAPDPW